MSGDSTMHTNIGIVKPPVIHKTSHLLTDVDFWTQQFALLANGKDDKIRALRKVINRQQHYLDKLKQSRFKGKEERRFFGKVLSLNEILKCHLHNVTYDVKRFANIVKKLNRFTKGCTTAAEVLYHSYRTARAHHDKQCRLTDIHKQRYYKFASRVVRADNEVSEDPRAPPKDRNALDVKRYNMDVHCLKYRDQFKRLTWAFIDVQALSFEVEKCYVSTMVARAELVLSCLQAMVDLTIAGKCDRREPVFTAIDPEKFVRETLLEFEIIQVPIYHDYGYGAGVKPRNSLSLTFVSGDQTQEDTTTVLPNSKRGSVVSVQRSVSLNDHSRTTVTDYQNIPIGTNGRIKSSRSVLVDDSYH